MVKTKIICSIDNLKLESPQAALSDFMKLLRMFSQKEIAGEHPPQIYYPGPMNESAKNEIELGDGMIQVKARNKGAW